jgi:hypothetical protein
MSGCKRPTFNSIEIVSVSREAFPKRPVLYWMCWGAILLLAVLLRFVPIRSGLPYSDYIDEGHVLHQTIDAFNQGSLDVYWYGLPALPAYSTGAALLLYGPFYRHCHGHRFQEDLPQERNLPTSSLNYDLIAPVELIVAGRVVTACLSIATVILAGIIAARLSNHHADLLAMLLTAVCPALVTRASIVIVDTFATFFVLAALYFSERIRSQGIKSIWRNAGLAGFATGLAFASKYTAAAAGLAVLASIFLLHVEWRSRLGLLFPTAGGCFFGILLGAPITFFKPIKVWRDVIANIRFYEQVRPAHSYLAQAISMFELGWPLLLAGCVGLILMLRAGRTRDLALGWLVLGAALIALFAGKSFQPFRNFLPLVPPLCIAAAITFAYLISWARSGTHQWLRHGVTIVLISGCAGSLGFSSYRQVEQRMADRDSRVQTVDWLRQHTGKQDRVLAIKELAILPSEWARIDAETTVVPWLEAVALLRSGRFDYLVTGELNLGPAPDPHWQDYRETWTHEIASLKVLAEFGTVATYARLYTWRTNNERIDIREVKQ